MQMVAAQENIRNCFDNSLQIIGETLQFKSSDKGWAENDAAARLGLIVSVRLGGMS